MTTERITLLKAGLVRPDGVVFDQAALEEIARATPPTIPITHVGDTSGRALGWAKLALGDGAELVAEVSWLGGPPQRFTHLSLSLVKETSRIVELFPTNTPLYTEVGRIWSPPKREAFVSARVRPYRQPRTALHLVVREDPAGRLPR